jgi:hypothetical protein
MKRTLIAMAAACLMSATFIGCGPDEYQDPGAVDGVDVEGAPPLDGEGPVTDDDPGDG